MSDMHTEHWKKLVPNQIWHKAHTYIWTTGITLVIIYAAKKTVLNKELDFDEFQFAFMIIALFILAFIKARMNFNKEKTFRMFYMTAITTLYILSMVLKALLLISLNIFAASSFAYCVSILFLASRK